MINGAHVVLDSQAAEADRAFLKDVVGLPHVDVGGGWLIFGLPPSEVAVHPAETGGPHELFSMVEDLEAFMAEMGRRGVACADVERPPWGALTKTTLPGGGQLGVYEPRQDRPPSA